MKRRVHRFNLLFTFLILTLLFAACSSTADDNAPDDATVLPVTDAADVVDATDAADTGDIEIIGGIPEEDNEFYEERTIFHELTELIERQGRVDEMLLAELSGGVYSFDHPLVIVNPYHVSPLTALVLFSSDEPMNISIHVPGRTELANVDFSMDGFNTRHEIPVYGLYPGELNMVQLTAVTRDGDAQSTTLEIQTDPLPPELAKNIIMTDIAQLENCGPGLNFTFAQKTAFDINGEYRWFYYDFELLASTLYNYNGNIIIPKGSFYEGDVLLLEINMLGKIISAYYSPFGAHHDIASISGGNLLVNGNRGETIEDLIYEIDVENGEIINTLDLKYVLQRTRSVASPEYSPWDWLHNNAIVYDDGNIVISGRHQSAVVSLSWPEGRIGWILSDHIGWNQMFHKYLLTPVGDNFEWFYGQHAPIILKGFDSDPDTIDILLFDNGNGRFDNDRELQRAIANNEATAPDRYSRMVHYRINERDMTVEQIWQFGKELGELYYTEGWCNAVLLSNGNRLGTFDRYSAEYGGNLDASIVEVDGRGNIIWEAFLTSTDDTGSFYAYRVERRPIYTEAANDLRIGVPARVFVPEEKRAEG